MANVVGKVKDIQPEFLPSFLNNQNQLDEGCEETNGLCLSNVYIPEEVLLHILAYVDPKEILKYSLVCHTWNKLIKSYALWSIIYKRKYNRKPKKLPWYLYYCHLSTNYFDTNLLRNGNGQDKFENWKIKRDGGDKCIIENPPVGADPLPLDVPEFYNKTSCFATSYDTCYKVQPVNFGNSKLFQYILDSYKPHIYLSEWTAGRFDCGCVYKLQCGFIKTDEPKTFSNNPCALNRVAQWEGSKWEKMEITVTEYPEGIKGIIFEHEGRDTQFWAGRYGSKMAGGVVKLLFDSIEPLPTNDEGIEKPKRFSTIQFVSNGEKEPHYDFQRFGMWNNEERAYDEDYIDESEDDDSDHDHMRVRIMQCPRL